MACSRARGGLRPEDPTTTDFDIDEYFLQRAIPETFRKAIKVKDKRHLLFATNKQMEIMATARTWYVHATFKVVKDPFKQLLSVHAFMRSGDKMNQVSLCFVLRNGKKAKDYTKILKTLKMILPMVQTKTFVVDFEAGLWKAIRHVFPEASVKGCVFHFSQALYKHISRRLDWRPHTNQRRCPQPTTEDIRPPTTTSSRHSRSLQATWRIMVHNYSSPARFGFCPKHSCVRLLYLKSWKIGQKYSIVVKISCLDCIYMYLSLRKHSPQYRYYKRLIKKNVHDNRGKVPRWVESFLSRERQKHFDIWPRIFKHRDVGITGISKCLQWFFFS